MIKEAAVLKYGVVFTGKRHNNIFNSAQALGLGFAGLRGGEQGFVTESGEYVNRRKAFEIALACGQVEEREKRKLFSEDLY